MPIPKSLFNCFEAEVADAGSYFACIVKERHVDSVRGDPADFGAHHHAMAVAKAIGLKGAQGTAAAQRRQQEVRDQIVVIERGLTTGPTDQDPVLSQQRNVLNQVDVQPLKTVGSAIGVAVVVKCGVIQTTPARVAWGLPPVDAYAQLRVDVIRIGAQPGRGLRRIDSFDGGIAPFSFPSIPEFIPYTALDRYPRDWLEHKMSIRVGLLKTKS